MTGCDDDDDADDELNGIALSQIGLSFFVLCYFLIELAEQDTIVCTWLYVKCDRLKLLDYILTMV